MIRLAWLFLFPFLITSCQSTTSTELLVFSKTAAFRHESIPEGIRMLQDIGNEKQWAMTFTENATIFESDSLSNFELIIWLNTTGDVLNEKQEIAFKNYIESGGAFMGIHAAADTEHDWPWYEKLVGAYFKNHPNDPNVFEADVLKSKEHDCCPHLPNRWTCRDEWYNFKRFMPHIIPVLAMDESSYSGGEHPDFHPISWHHSYLGGPMFYTGIGHSKEIYSNPDYNTFIANAITELLDSEP